MQVRDANQSKKKYVKTFAFLVIISTTVGLNQEPKSFYNTNRLAI